MRRTRFCLAIALIVATVSLSGVSRAQSVTAEQPTDSATEQSNEATSAPSPKELVRSAADYLENLPAASYVMAVKYRVEAPQMNYDMSHKTTVRFQRPNRLAAILEEGTMGTTIVSDGTNVVEFVPMLNRYATTDAPENLTDIPSPAVSLTGEFLPLAALAGGDPLFEALTSGVTDSEYLGEEDFEGVRCHHFRLDRDDVDLEVWLDAGEKPLIRKIALDISSQLAETGAELAALLKHAKLEFYFAFLDWNTEPKLTDSDFQFTPPEGAEEVESLFEGLAGGETGPHPLLGEDAPTFETVDLDDNKIDLAAHLGNDVVILDFWATWCGPCVDAMPLISTVANKFADRGVVLYAVNVGEDAETIKTFLESKELALTVALDPQGEVSNLYRADAIPQTVIIGKDKRVQVVHIGFSTELEDVLASNLEALLAGEDLATAELRELKAQQEESEQEAEADAEPVVEEESAE